MGNILQIIFDLVIWIFVPHLLVLALWYTYSLVRKADDRRVKDSLRAAFYSGFLLFIIVFIYQVGIILKTAGAQVHPLYQGFDVWLALSAALLAFVLFSGGRRAIPPRFKGWTVFLLSFLEFYALFHYFFIRDYNEILLSLILGTALGILVHGIAFPPAREFPKIAA